MISSESGPSPTHDLEQLLCVGGLQLCLVDHEA